MRTLRSKRRTQVTPGAPPTDYQTVAAPGGRTNTRTNTRTCSRTNPFRQCFTPKAKNVQAARENFPAARKKISTSRKCFTACRYYLVSPLVRLQVSLGSKKQTLIFRQLSARCKRCHLYICMTLSSTSLVHFVPNGFSTVLPHQDHLQKKYNKSPCPGTASPSSLVDSYFNIFLPSCM